MSLHPERKNLREIEILWREPSIYFARLIYGKTFDSEVIGAEALPGAPVLRA